MRKLLILYRNILQDVIYRLDDYNYEMEDLPDGASWSRYSMTVAPVQKSYQAVHLDLLYALSGDKLINDLDKFENIPYYLDRWTKAYEYRYPDEDISNILNTVLADRKE